MGFTVLLRPRPPDPQHWQLVTEYELTDLRQGALRTLSTRDMARNVVERFLVDIFLEAFCYIETALNVQDSRTQYIGRNASMHATVCSRTGVCDERRTPTP